jgi:hypothetical protein
LETERLLHGQTAPFRRNSWSTARVDRSIRPHWPALADPALGGIAADTIPVRETSQRPPALTIIVLHVATAGEPKA